MPTHINIKRLALATLASFIVIFVFEFLLHGIALKSTYAATQNLWRPMDEMNSYMPYITLSQIILAALTSIIYALYTRQKSAMDGIKMGAILGLLIGSIQIGSYFYMPIPLSLALSWSGGMIAELTIAGALIGVIYKD